MTPRRGSLRAEPETLLPGEVVKELVSRIPEGFVATYGTIGRAALGFGRPIGGARTVAWILASLKGRDATPWHRVVGAGGKILLPGRRGALQRSRLRGEAVRFARTIIAPECLVDATALLSVQKPARRVRSS